MRLFTRLALVICSACFGLFMLASCDAQEPSAPQIEEQEAVESEVATADEEAGVSEDTAYFEAVSGTWLLLDAPDGLRLIIDQDGEFDLTFDDGELGAYDEIAGLTDVEGWVVLNGVDDNSTVYDLVTAKALHATLSVPLADSASRGAEIGYLRFVGEEDSEPYRLIHQTEIEETSVSE